MRRRWPTLRCSQAAAGRGEEIPARLKAALTQRPDEGQARPGKTSFSAAQPASAPGRLPAGESGARTKLSVMT